MVTGSPLVTSQQGCLGALALWLPLEGVGCGGVGHGRKRVPSCATADLNVDSRTADVWKSL